MGKDRSVASTEAAAGLPRLPKGSDSTSPHYMRPLSGSLAAYTNRSHRKLTSSEMKASADRLSTPLHLSRPASEAPGGSGRSAGQLSEAAQAARDVMKMRAASDTRLLSSRRSGTSGRSTSKLARRHTSSAELAMDFGIFPRVIMDKETEEAMARRLSRPRRVSAGQEKPVPRKLVQSRCTTTGRLVELTVPLEPRSAEEQVQYMAGMYDKALEAEERRKAKLAHKYLQPLVKSKKIGTVDDMIEHLTRLDLLHHGVSSQAESIPRPHGPTLLNGEQRTSMNGRLFLELMDGYSRYD